MPVLDNARHELFAQELAKGKSATEAYRDAGYKDNRQAASALLTNLDLKERVAELQQTSAELVGVTADSICAELDETIKDAKADKQHSARVSAIMGKAKVCGLLTDTVNATVKNYSPSDLRKLTNDELEQALRIAAKLTGPVRLPGRG